MRERFREALNLVPAQGHVKSSAHRIRLLSSTFDPVGALCALVSALRCFKFHLLGPKIEFCLVSPQ